MCSTEDIAEFHEFLASKKSHKRRHQEGPGPYLPGEHADNNGSSSDVDSLQVTAHRLVNHHFNITKNWTANTQMNRDAWRAIVCEVSTFYTMSTYSYIANQFPTQMQELHPRFLYHEDDWILRHMTISRLATTTKKFKRMVEDPDIEIHHGYMARQAQKAPAPFRGPIPWRINKV